IGEDCKKTEMKIIIAIFILIQFFFAGASGQNKSDANIEQTEMQSVKESKNEIFNFCTIRLSRDDFRNQKEIKVSSKKSCTLVVKGTSTINTLSIYTANPKDGGKLIINKSCRARRKIRLDTSGLSSGEYFMIFSGCRHSGWTTLTVE